MSRCLITTTTAISTSIFVNSLTVDLVKSKGKTKSDLYRNDGNGKFTEVGEKAGVSDIGWGMGVAVGDYNNDGFEDLYVTCLGPDHLLKNNGNGTFTDVTAKAGVNDPRWTTGAVVRRLRSRRRSRSVRLQLRRFRHQQPAGVWPGQDVPVQIDPGAVWSTEV